MLDSEYFSWLKVEFAEFSVILMVHEELEGSVYVYLLATIYPEFSHLLVSTASRGKVTISSLLK